MAPSPTGYLHIGTARTTLFNYLYAHRTGGTFILRIEDTDKERSTREFEDNIIQGLGWLGLHWNEGPYRQSERTDIYTTALRKLLDSGNAFYCTHTIEDLEKEKQSQMSGKEALRHKCSDRDAAKTDGIIRLRNDISGRVAFNDLIRKEVSFDASLLGDFSLAKDLNTPLYNLAAVVDDEDMNISHVIRGEDHIPNTPKQILIAQALGYSNVIFAHLPLILGPDKSKLSKRHGETSINEYRNSGYLPEALVNFIALLGWSPGNDRELFSLAELKEEFSLDKVQKSGAIFNIEKLKWLNGEYIRKMSIAKLAEEVKPFIEDWDSLPTQYLERVTAIEQPRLKTLADIKEHPFYFHEPAYDVELLRWKGSQEYSAVLSNIDELEKILRDISDDDFSSQDTLRERIMPFAEERGKGEVLWPLRTLLSGLKASPDPIEILSVIGKEATLLRIQKAKEMVSLRIKN